MVIQAHLSSTANTHMAPHDNLTKLSSRFSVTWFFSKIRIREAGFKNDGCPLHALL